MSDTKEKESKSFEEQYPKLTALMKEMLAVNEERIRKEFTELMDEKHGPATGQYPQVERFASYFEVYRKGRQDNQLHHAMADTGGGFQSLLFYSTRRAIENIPEEQFQMNRTSAIADVVEHVLKELRKFGY